MKNGETPTPSSGKKSDDDDNMAELTRQLNDISSGSLNLPQTNNNNTPTSQYNNYEGFPPMSNNIQYGQPSQTNNQYDSQNIGFVGQQFPSGYPSTNITSNQYGGGTASSRYASTIVTTKPTPSPRNIDSGNF